MDGRLSQITTKWGGRGLLWTGSAFRDFLMKRAMLATIAFGLASSVTSGAFAQANCTFGPNNAGISNFLPIAALNSSISAAFVGAVSQINTAFISQQGSAFVSAPGNPAPDQPGSGVWIRGVGGEVATKSVTNSTTTITTPGAGFGNGTVLSSCSNNQRTDFGGVQIGQDIARLNWSGWNVHLGTTAGYVSARTAGDGFTTNFEVPFLGAYVVATHGRFFADVMVRRDFFDASVSSPSFSIPNTPIGARGLSISTSAGYNFALANDWFIEPSAGFIWSTTKVDNFTQAGSEGGTISGGGTIITAGAVSTSDITSKIGRLSARIGTTVGSGNVTWQPFASVSVFHEFAGAVASGAQLDTHFGPIPSTTIQQSVTSRIGTYGQYSLGLAGSINNTGWLGFARVDYRNGSNIDGWVGNAGLRYQFTPEAIAAVMPTKAPAKALPLVSAVNWTGFYVGGFLGAAYGRSDIRFVGDPAGAGNNPWVFGGLGGGQIGYNYQLNNWVFGIEGDIGGTNLHGARTCGNAIGADPVTFQPAFFSPFLLTCGDGLNWIATAAARLGWASGRTLYFVKAGGAWAGETTSVGCVIAPANQADPLFNNFCRNQANVKTLGFSTSGNRAGWTVGFGAEFDLGKNWSAKAEYDYIDFGSRTALATDGTTILRTATTVSEVKIGVNYRFAPGIVVAKY
ncbi:autotransporter domain-containing protein [Bradyrhizobium sp. AUGA SZCCT0182]|uniref:autotransporter domain-containing protein n=1 Tax=Bradyrhizobium sp. AUGA SZCCT0182 TaxID=2807667 RepID=UPI001BACDCE2|nr:autotransporter domain-containing protein [Bradyrhizobium sp. AUGA SZCCT0182]MBR1232041.1 autotransporter domain-containing protein [Bradyrhizobium sp. AUGA SZCCT0182]